MPAASQNRSFVLSGQIAIRDARAMCAIQRDRDLGRDAQRVVERQRRARTE